MLIHLTHVNPMLTHLTVTLLRVRPPEHAVPGQPALPAGSEEEDGVRGAAAPPAGSVLCGRAPGLALGLRAQAEECGRPQQVQGDRGRHSGPQVKHQASARWIGGYGVHYQQRASHLRISVYSIAV